MRQVKWVKSTSDSWLSLANIDLTNVTTTGVYVIWQAVQGGQVVRVGQGDISTRLEEHRQNRWVTRHGESAGLLVTWASVPLQSDRDGIENFLASKYSPLEGKRFPDVLPIEVNLVA